MQIADMSDMSLYRKKCTILCMSAVMIVFRNKQIKHRPRYQQVGRYNVIAHFFLSFRITEAIESQLSNFRYHFGFSSGCPLQTSVALFASYFHYFILEFCQIMQTINSRAFKLQLSIKVLFIMEYFILFEDIYLKIKKEICI